MASWTTHRPTWWTLTQPSPTSRRLTHSFKDNISCPDGSHKVTPYTHCCEAAVARPFELTKLETVYAPRGEEGHDEHEDLLSRAQVSRLGHAKRLCSSLTVLYGPCTVKGWRGGT